jgi:hypothetical protein
MAEVAGTWAAPRQAGALPACHYEGGSKEQQRQSALYYRDIHVSAQLPVLCDSAETNITASSTGGGWGRKLLVSL